MEKKTAQHPGNLTLDILQEEILILPLQQQIILDSSRERFSMNKNAAN